MGLHDIRLAAYGVASILFVLSLKGMSEVRTSRLGNWAGIGGMLLGVVATLVAVHLRHIDWVVGAIVIGVALGVPMALFVLAGLLRQPIGIAIVAACYGVYRAVLVVVGARLQERIESRSRATVTSVAGLGTDVASFAIYGAWVLGEVPGVAAVGLLTALALPYLLRARPPAAGGG